MRLNFLCVAQGGVHCSSPKADMKILNSHPKVYLDVAREGQAKCPLLRKGGCTKSRWAFHRLPLTDHAFLVQALHQPLLATSLLPNTAQLPVSSPALP